MMHIADGEAQGERGHARELDQRGAPYELSGHGPECLAFEQESEADDHQYRAQDARDVCRSRHASIPPL